MRDPSKELLAIGVALQEDYLIESYYTQLRGLFITEINKGDKLTGTFLDLNSLPSEPVNLKSIVIRWLIQANLPRINAGMDPIFPMSLIMRCPIWRFIRPPIRRIGLTPEEMFGKNIGAKKITKVGTIGAVKTIGSIGKQSKGSINRKRK